MANPKKKLTIEEVSQRQKIARKKPVRFLPGETAETAADMEVANNIFVPKGTPVKVLNTSADPDHLRVDIYGVKVWLGTKDLKKVKG